MPVQSRSTFTAAVRLLALAFALLPATAAFAAIKTDIVELANGDRVTCEIRKLERGKLTVKTDGIGTISIEWNDVQHVTARRGFDLELESGQRLFGSIARADAGTLEVVTLTGSERVPIAEVVRISPLGGTFWTRLDGNIDAGFSFTQANVQTQWTFNSSISYRSRRLLSTLDADSALTTQEDAERQSRNALGLQTQRFLKPRMSALGFAQFQQNEELSLLLRTVLGGGLGWKVKQSNRTEFVLVGGAAATNEQYRDAEDDSIVEAVAGGTFGWFTFDGRSTNLDVKAFVFYGLAQNNRTRFELKSSFKSDIVGDLYWSINVFESYNSAPPTGSKGNDFGVSAALGWSF